jgi:CRP-like cAMP-binding protein
MAQPPSTSAIRNTLLATLPPGTRARVLPKLHAVTLPLRRTLCVPQKRIEAVYFIESGWVSMVAHFDGGTQAEVGLVGFEGMVGLPLVVGVDTAFTDTYMQASGTGLQKWRRRHFNANWKITRLSMPVEISPEVPIENSPLRC